MRHAFDEHPDRPVPPGGRPARRRTPRLGAGLAVWLVAGGCSSLLPRGSNVDVSRFASFEEARTAFEQVTPYRSTLDDLRRLGFDPQSSANVEQVPYPQWVAMLVHPSASPDQSDTGIRDCFAAERACQAYVFRFSRSDRARSGGFLADFFNFRRVTHTQGWRFEGVALVRDGLVLFRNVGGQPRLQSVEDRRNPLGPLQSIGETAPRELRP
ncbi:hypothetical protein [Caldimonas sp. KR1-144]|uniref:hypothetical protein n=1 Tax=Caldimonas sp. KR1-144 TaxID=3400911 RepID=UPI003C0C9ED5